ncbi:hypothetical protein ACOSQ3_002640 [Xanthoceras sorbifolium]
MDPSLGYWVLGLAGPKTLHYMTIDENGSWCPQFSVQDFLLCLSSRFVPRARRGLLSFVIIEKLYLCQAGG